MIKWGNNAAISNGSGDADKIRDGSSSNSTNNETHTRDDNSWGDDTDEYTG